MAKLTLTSLTAQFLLRQYSKVGLPPHQGRPRTVQLIVSEKQARLYDKLLEEACWDGRKYTAALPTGAKITKTSEGIEAILTRRNVLLKYSRKAGILPFRVKNYKTNPPTEIWYKNTGQRIIRLEYLPKDQK